MTIAIFDLDNTLLNGDSDHAWGEFLIDSGLVDSHSFRKKNDQFYHDYEAGSLDIAAYQFFVMQPVMHLSEQQLSQLHQKYMQSKIKPMSLPKAHALIDTHRHQGHQLVIITATNQFITTPIAKWLGVETLIATELEKKNGYYTGKIINTPCFQTGKVTRLEQWLLSHPNESLEGSYFYSDSANDIPLLETVTHPYAVDADPKLRAYAEKKGWDTISLRETR